MRRQNIPGLESTLALVFFGSLTLCLLTQPLLFSYRMELLFPLFLFSLILMSEVQDRHYSHVLFFLPGIAAFACGLFTIVCGSRSIFESLPQRISAENKTAVGILAQPESEAEVDELIRRCGIDHLSKESRVVVDSFTYFILKDKITPILGYYVSWGISDPLELMKRLDKLHITKVLLSCPSIPSEWMPTSLVADGLCCVDVQNHMKSQS